MTLFSKHKGKNVKISDFRKNPKFLRVCQRSGFVFQIEDTAEQLEWYGNSLVGNKFFVGKQYLDVPSQINRPPKIKSDPYPIKDPRPPASLGGTPAPYQSNNQIFANLINFNWFS